MSQAIKPTADGKSRKSFPLTRRGDGLFQKKIRGQIYYFYGTEQEALDEWLAVKDDLYAGRGPWRDGPSEGKLTIGSLCEKVVASKEPKCFELGWTENDGPKGKISERQNGCAFNWKRCISSLQRGMAWTPRVTWTGGCESSPRADKHAKYTTLGQRCSNG